MGRYEYVITYDKKNFLKLNSLFIKNNLRDANIKKHLQTELNLVNMNQNMHKNRDN